MMFKVVNTKSILLISIVLTLGGCSSPAPMQISYSSMNTPVFEPVALSTVKDGSEKILFKECTTMYENKDFKLWGVFFITNNGIYLVKWSTRGYEYNLRYKLPVRELQSTSDYTIVRDMWVDTNLLMLKDKSWHEVEVWFALNGKNAARSILKEISTK